MKFLRGNVEKFNFFLMKKVLKYMWRYNWLELISGVLLTSVAFDDLQAGSKVRKSAPITAILLISNLCYWISHSIGMVNPLKYFAAKFPKPRYYTIFALNFSIFWLSPHHQGWWIIQCQRQRRAHARTFLKCVKQQ